jgi:hypothetical protein
MLLLYAIRVLRYAEEVPKEVLKCKAVAREIVFSSAEEVAGFRYISPHHAVPRMHDTLVKVQL